MKDIVKLSDIELISLTETVRRESISDEVYFSDKYSDYISNSRLKYINPKQDGSPEQYKQNARVESTSLQIGSGVHCCLLQPESFELAPKIGKPGAKLGMVLDYIPKFLNKNYSLDEAIKAAAIKVQYYVNTIDRRIDAIKAAWLEYSNNVNNLLATSHDKELIILSDKDHDTVSDCLSSCYQNRDIMSKLHPVDVFGDPIPSYNEDALFMNYIVKYNHTCDILKFKMKADNWSINYDNRIVTLNDLKTSSHPIDMFMQYSFNKYCYYRQMACYSKILWEYCRNEFGVNEKTGWKLDVNMLVVETTPNHQSACFNVPKNELIRGEKQFNNLMKMVGYYKMFGYNKIVEFV